MKLPPDWSEFIDLLHAHEVRYLIVGAHALAAIGRPRATGDIDFLVEPTTDNASRLSEALRQFGFGALADEAHRFAVPGNMAHLGQPPLQIDIMSSIDGLDFDEAWRGRLEGNLGTHKVPFLGRAEFIKNKRASGRAKDLLDIELLSETEY